MGLKRVGCSFRFRILKGRTPKGKFWMNLEFSWGHQIIKVGELYRENWDEISIGLHTWWLWPAFHNEFYDGPHPAICLGFIVITWEPWGFGEWLEPAWIDGKKVESK